MSYQSSIINQEELNLLILAGTSVEIINAFNNNKISNHNLQSINQTNVKCDFNDQHGQYSVL